MTRKPKQELQPVQPATDSEQPDQPFLPGLSSEGGTRQAQHFMHVGPVPAPEVLAGYSYIDESFPNRIVTMAEENARTGRLTAERAQTFLLIERIVARSLGLIFACSAIGAAVYLAVQGHDTVAGVIAGATVVAVTAAIITGRSP